MGRITRRLFLAGGIGAVGVAGAGGVVIARARSFDEVVALIVRHNLDPIPVPAETMGAFTADLTAKHTLLFRGQTMKLARYVPDIYLSDTLRSMLPDGVHKSMEFVEREIMTKFLLSTDFFSQPMGPEMTISYIAYADPYETPCLNPLADFTA